MAIRLLVGLGNPGPRYARTRHNIGARWLAALAARFAVPLTAAARFRGALGRGDMHGHDVRLLLPTTYMNLSGDAVGAVAGFYKIEPEEVLVAHDEVAFPVGICRLKGGGGHNGHNGLKSVIAALGNERGFARLRIGVGHPGDSADLVAYLTGPAMPAEDANAALAAATLPDAVLGAVLRGELPQAMNALHAPAPQPRPCATTRR